jgi:hypothetical protein
MTTINVQAGAALPNPGLRVGILLDASAQHAGRTGREVLALSALVMACRPGGRMRCSTGSGSARLRAAAGPARTRRA